MPAKWTNLKEHFITIMSRDSENDLPIIDERAVLKRLSDLESQNKALKEDLGKVSQKRFLTKIIVQSFYIYGTFK